MKRETEELNNIREKFPDLYELLTLINTIEFDPEVYIKALVDVGVDDWVKNSKDAKGVFVEKFMLNGGNKHSCRG